MRTSSFTLRIALAGIAAVTMGLAAPAVYAAPAVAEQPSPIAQLASNVASGVVAHLGALVPHDTIERVVAYERDLRDAARTTETRLMAWAAKQPGIDLTVLKVHPLDDGDAEDLESSGFGWRDDPFRHVSRFHSGSDIHAAAGTIVRAAGDGVVVFAGRQGGYGNIVYVDHGGGVVTRYAHLRKIITHKDAVVAAGDTLGEVGSTGRATGPHLHFEVRLDGNPVDPNTAMHVATLERDVPDLGRLAAYALAPGVQAKVHDIGDSARAARKTRTGRPERAGRSERPQILW
jgi:murein DD-endopeptidase MepM/ murein hydrolase activator NlpD